ncbi:hypothetical protein [Geodermatophilus sp. URMC 60]
MDGVPSGGAQVLTIAVLLAFLATLTVADLLPHGRAAMVPLPR